MQNDVLLSKSPHFDSSGLLRIAAFGSDVYDMTFYRFDFKIDIFFDSIRFDSIRHNVLVGHNYLQGCH